MKTCHIKFTMANGISGHVDIPAKGPMDALCIWLDTLKETPARSVLAKLCEPVEIAQ